MITQRLFQSTDSPSEIEEPTFMLLRYFEFEGHTFRYFFNANIVFSWAVNKYNFNNN